MVGFKYFSSQGGYDPGSGGLDYRYAVFDEFGAPPMPYLRDLGVIYSTSQVYLNTGMMYSPAYWVTPRSATAARPDIVTEFDPVYFDGRTADD